MIQKRRKKALRRIAWGTGFGTVLLLLACLLSSVNWRLLTHGDTAWHEVNELGFFGAALYQIWQLPQKLLEDRKSLQLDRAVFASYLAKRHVEIEKYRAPQATRKNVIFIQFESVDNFCVDTSYKGKEIMPFFNSIKQKGLYFSNTLDTTGGGRTSDAEFLVLTSAPPLPDKPVFINYDLQKIPSLPRTLKQEGYFTFSIHGFNGLFWNRELAHRALGYEKSFFLEDLDREDLIGWGISDRSILDQALQRIVQSSRPVFAHIVLLTNHHPYHHVGVKFGFPKENIHESYLESVGYTDAAVADFYARLKRAGLLENSIIALFGDHDSSIQKSLVEFLDILPRPTILDKVPLLILGLVSTPQVQDELAGLQDVPVIVLNELGIPTPHTFTGNPYQLAGNTISAFFGPVTIENGSLKKQPGTFGYQDLTRLSILDPASLESNETQLIQ